MKTNITITYNSGEVATYIVKPPDYRLWEIKFGKSIGESNGINDIMFLAYTAMSREVNGKNVKPYEAWCLSVDDISTGEEDPKAIPSEA